MPSHAPVASRPVYPVDFAVLRRRAARSLLVGLLGSATMVTTVGTVVTSSGCATTAEKTEPQARSAPNEPWREARPPAGPTPPVVFPTMQQKVLKNGLTLIVIEDHALPTVHASLVVRAGSAADGRDPGIADLTWDLLDEGAGGMAAAELQNAFADIGAEVSTGGGRESGSISTRVLSENLERALELMGLVAQKPSFASFDFERKQKLHISALKAKEGNPRSVASEILAAKMYGEDHPYGHADDGTVRSLEKLKVNSVKRFWSDNAGPKNSALVLVGDVTLDDASAMVEKALGRWRGGKTPKAPKASSAKDGGKIFVVDFPGSPQTIVRFGRPLLAAGDEGEAALIAMHQVLGGMFSSRLNLKLREEKQWTYGASSFLGRRLGPGPFGVATDVQTDNTGDAVAEIFAQLEAMKTTDVTDTELALAKDNYIRSLPGLFSLPPLQKQVAAELFSQGLPPDFYPALSANVEAVTVADVKAAAERALVKEDFVVLLVGDRAAILKGLEGKNLGEVVVLTKSGELAPPEAQPPAAPPAESAVAAPKEEAK